MAGTATLKLYSFSSISSSSSLFPCSSFSSKPYVLPMRVFPGTFSTTRFFRIYALSSNDIKVCTNIEVDGPPWRVLEFLHVKPGKGAAFVRTKLRNYITGNTIDEADVFKETKQFTYKDGGSKPATLDTVAVVNVPLFINAGDEILVDTRTGQ